MSRPITTFARSAIFLALILPLLLAGQTGAQNYTQQLQKSIGIDQKLGDQIPLDLEFTDSNGKRTALRQYFGKKPIVLTLVYYECPMLCTQVLNSLLRAMNVLSFGIGTDFDVLTISVDPGETPELAAAKKAEYSKNYRGRDGSTGWHFLTGGEDQIKQLAAAVGFRYEYDEDTRPVHPRQRLDGADAGRQTGALSIRHRLPSARLALGPRRSSRRCHRQSG